MKLKYATIGKPMGSRGKGKKSNPDNWITGPCLITREKYYAYLKHRAQAKFRGEDYDLTWEQWQTLWKDDNWNCRGQKHYELILGRIDWSKGWNEHNVEIMTRRKHFEIKKERNARS